MIYSVLPHHMQGQMEAYLEEGVPQGDFLRSVLCNDLREAASHADDINRYRLYDYVEFLASQAPIGSWGSPENYQRWIQMGGINGETYMRENQK